MFCPDHLLPSNTGNPCKCDVLTNLQGGVTWRFPIVRAFNDGSLRPRVARAQAILSLSFPSCSRRSSLASFFSSHSGGVARLPLTARIGRAQFHRARSACKKGTWPLLFYLSKLARVHSPGRAPMLVYVRPSNEALLRARVPGAQDQRGCPSFPIVGSPRAATSLLGFA